MNIYIAAPLHDEEDKKRNIELVSKIRQYGHYVYLPQEVGVWESALKRFDNDIGRTQAYFYKCDLRAMKVADMCIAYQDRPDKGPSEGMLWEMGWFSCAEKTIILINPTGHQYNPMPASSCKHIYNSVDAFISDLSEGVYGN